MRLQAFILVGWGLIGVAQAQSAAPLQYLPVPAAMPETAMEVGILTDDPSDISTALRRSIQEPPLVPGGLPAPVTEQAAISATPPAEPGVPALPGAESPGEAEPAATAALPEEAPEPPLPPQTTSVTVIVEGITVPTGTVNVGICDKGLSREGCPYNKEVPAGAGYVETTFEDLEPGTYAVVGYQDVNGNSEFDKFLGMPKEPYALSNNAGAKMVPTFRDAALPIKKGENTVIIRLQSLLGG